MSDPFATLGVTPAFELDLGELERRYRDLSRALHPDRYVGKSAGERRQALGKAIEVNDAWRVLKQPVRRAEALLARLGIEVGEGREPEASQEFLMDVLERREELAEARRGRDPARVENLARAARAERERLLGELGRGFREALAGNGASARLGLVRQVGELRYWERFLEEVAVIQDEIL